MQHRYPKNASTPPHRRTRFIWVAPLAGTAGLALALQLTAGVAAAAPTGSVLTLANGRTNGVTLPTGDYVELSGARNAPTVLIRPSRVAGPGRVLVTRRVGSDTYVMPVDAQPYVGRFLDRELFDVSRIAAAQKTNGRFPVRISYQGPVPSVPGVTITSASHGVAEGYLTPSSSPALGRALASQFATDNKAGWPNRASLFHGMTKMTSALTGPALTTSHSSPPALDPTTVTLTVQAIGPDGGPQAEGQVDLMNVDNEQTYEELVDIVGGQATVNLPPGDYSALGEDYAADTATGSSTLKIVSVSDYKVATAGQTLTLDYRTATERPSVAVPRKHAVQGYILDWVRGDALADLESEVDYTATAGSQVLLAPSKPATTGTLNVAQSWQLTGPGRIPSYTYDLAALAPRIPANLHYTFTAADLGTVKSAYYRDGPAKTGSFVRAAQFPFGEGTGADFRDVPLGTARTEYVGATGGTPVWIEDLLGDVGSADDPEAISGLPRSIAAGTTQRVDWLRGPLGAALPQQANGGSCYVCRTSGTIEVALAPFTDSTPGHIGSMFTDADGIAVTRFQFYENGVLVSDQDDALGGAFSAPAAATTYQAVLNVDRRQQDPAQSTSSLTRLTFTSAAGSGGTLPADWSCDLGVTSSCRVLPVLQAKLALPTSLNGTLPTGRSAVTVSVARAQYASAATSTSATLEFRPAGWDWTLVPLTAVGGGKYSGTIDNTGYTGSNVDIRVSAADSDGSTYQQTVLRAYTVTTP